jgi:4'-phosphopantetheinyl transferase EntD
MSGTVEACVNRLQQHFGPGVLCDVVSADGDPGRLLAEELALVADAVPARRREFAAGRECARRLLGRIGFQPAPLLAAADRAPIWPSGAIGSISHGEGVCAVAVSRSERLTSLGLDVEPDEPLEEDLWPTICTPREIRHLSSLPHALRGRTARLYFSAKECTYKCLYPLTRIALGFHDVEIELPSGGEEFHAVLARGSSAFEPGQRLQGFRLAEAGVLLTGIALPAACARERVVVP